MTINRLLRLIAGVFILLSVALGHLISPWFYLLTAFVGLNLLQSAFSNACPAISLLRRLGVQDDTRGPLTHSRG